VCKEHTKNCRGNDTSNVESAEAPAVNVAPRTQVPEPAPPLAPGTPLNAPGGSPSTGELPYLERFSPLNKWELSVRPGDSSILNEPLLRKTPYIINTCHNALICVECKHAVSVKAATSHARKVHSCRYIPREFEEQIVSKYSSLVSHSIQPDQICDPVFGLAIPLDPYVICSRCTRGYFDLKSLTAHQCQDAHVPLNGRPPHFSSLVQTFFRGRELCYFPIHSPQSAPPASNDFTLFKKQFQGNETTCNEFVESINYRQMNQFLHKEGWMAHVEGCAITKLVELVSLPSADNPTSHVAPNLRILLSNIQDIISQRVFHVRKLLGRRPSCVYCCAYLCLDY
jgi:hypothetical protein